MDIQGIGAPQGKGNRDFGEGDACSVRNASPHTCRLYISNRNETPGLAWPAPRRAVRIIERALHVSARLGWYGRARLDSARSAAGRPPPRPVPVAWPATHTATNCHNDNAYLFSRVLSNLRPPLALCPLRPPARPPALASSLPPVQFPNQLAGLVPFPSHTAPLDQRDDPDNPGH